MWHQFQFVFFCFVLHCFYNLIKNQKHEMNFKVLKIKSIQILFETYKQAMREEKKATHTLTWFWFSATKNTVSKRIGEFNMISTIKVNWSFTQCSKQQQQQQQHKWNLSETTKRRLICLLGARKQWPNTKMIMWFLRS